MTIKTRLILLAVAVSIAIVLQTLYFSYNIFQLEKLDNSRIGIGQVNSGMLALRKHEKDFLARYELAYRDKFSKEYQLLQKELGGLHDSLEKLALPTEQVDAVVGILATYHKQFISLTVLQEKIGLNEKSGLYGSLRDSVHAAEREIKAVGDNALLADMLMLRRNEKDFMLRSALKYQDKFNANFNHMMVTLDRDGGMGMARKNRIKASMNKYHDDFNMLVAGYREKGLTEKEGLRGEMRNTVHKTEGVLAVLSTDMKSVVTERIDSVVSQGYWLVALFAPTILLFMLRSCTSISRPLDRMVGIVTDIHNNHDLTLRVNAEGKDEIAMMANHLNAMLEDFQKIIGEVSRSVSTLAAASTELSAVTEQTSTGMKQQSDETQQVVSVMDQLMHAVDTVVTSTNDAMTHAEQASLLAQQGDHAVHETTQVIDSLAKSVMQASEVISRLQYDSENIGGVVDVINGIAEQTNLLALNAAIEAARAGEQGRGFAVVADEVRSLATRTQQSTQEITAMVERLQFAAGDAVEVMEQGKGLAENGVSNTANTRKTIASIGTAIETINRMAKEIANATREQSAMAGVVGTNVGTITRITAETSDSGNYISRAAHDLSQTATELQVLIERFNC